MKKKEKNKAFKDWTYEEVNDEFGLTRKFEHPLFEVFKSFFLPQTHERRIDLDYLRKLALEYIESWNEDEYKFFFISRFIGLVDFVSTHYKAFTQRSLSVKYQNDTKTTEGLVEFMLAKGIQSPKKPHLFLHESMHSAYKPEKRRDNAPLGQLLIAMVTAQKLNQDNQPIYGIYLNGQNWFIVILEEKSYAVSLAYDITSEDIFNLFEILLFLKGEMEKLYSGGKG